MKLFFGLRLAKRYFFSKKSHNAVNIITAVALCTTAIATAAIIIVLSVFNGFTSVTESKFSKLDPPLKITTPGGVPFDVDSVLEALDVVKGVGGAIPVVETKVFLKTSASQSVGRLLGVDHDFRSLSSIDDAIIDGVDFIGDTLGASWGVIGSGLAMNLNVRPGSNEEVGMMVPKAQGRINPGSLLSAFRSDSLKLAGVVRIDDPSADETVVYYPIERVRRMAGIGERQATGLYLYPDEGIDMEALDRLAHSRGLEILDIYRQNVDAFKMINVEKWITFALLAFILLIASFNIVSTLAMLIIEKRANMGVLRSIGCTRSTVKSIFAWEGLILSVMGGVAGCFIGSLLVLCQQWFGWVKLSSSVDTAVLTLDVYPVALKASDFFVVLGLIILMSVLTTVVALSTFSTDDDKLIA